MNGTQPEKRKSKIQIQPTLVELEAEINRDLQTPLERVHGVSDAIQRVRRRESLVRQYMQQAIGDMLLQFTARSSKANRYQALPNLAKLRMLMRYPDAPDTVDEAYIHLMRPRFATVAKTEHQRAGRGAIIVDITNTQQDDAPVSWQPLDQLDSKSRGIATKYDPTKEFVVVIVRPQNERRIYRVDFP